MRQVRRLTGEQLYACVLTYDDVAPAEHADEIMQIVSESAWYDSQL